MNDALYGGVAAVVVLITGDDRIALIAVRRHGSPIPIFLRTMHAPNIDLSALDQLFDGDQARVREWIAIYLEEAPPLFHRLCTAQEKGDVEGLTSVAHDLRPLAHYLGAPHILDLLTTMGQRARSEGAAACHEQVRELSTFGANAETELRATLIT